MPQVKGHATFLTNLRRTTTELERRIGIDNSDAHIENEAIEGRKEKRLELIHLQQHRALVDRDYELSETRRDCCNYQRMVSLARETRVEAIMEERRREKADVFRRLTAGDGDGAAIRGSEMAAVRRPPPPSTTRARLVDRKTGFSHVAIDDSDTDGEGEPMERRRTVPDTAALAPRTTAYPTRSRRRPRTSHPARSIRQIRQALEKEFSAPRPRRRPKTTLGFWTAKDDDPDGGGAGGPAAGGYAPGRSFNELKDLTHIDHLNDAHIRAKQEEIRKIRSERLAEQQKVLQNRLDQFYARLDKFKKDSNRSVLKSTLIF